MCLMLGNVTRKRVNFTQKNTHLFIGKVKGKIKDSGVYCIKAGYDGIKLHSAWYAGQ